MTNMGDLFRIARQYGKVNLFTHDDGTYNVNIKFSTIELTSLEARSGFNHMTPEAALEKAIRSAEEIVSSLGKMPERKLLG